MYQSVTVIGNVGRDPEMRYLPNGTPVCHFTVATNRRWTNANGEQQEKTTWFRVTTWRKLAEICNQYLTKGRLVLVEGEIDARAWTSPEGEARAGLELNARNVKFLGGRGDQGGGGGAQEPADAYGEAPGNEDEIPF